MKLGIIAAVVLGGPAIASAQSEPAPEPTPAPSAPSAPSAPPEEPEAVPGVMLSERASTTEAIGSSPRGAAMDWLVMPTGYDVGGALRYAMSPPGALGERPLRFTDLAFLDLHARFALGGAVETTVGTTIVPKQPSDADELVWQGSGLGLRWQPSGKRKLVLGAGAAGGPMLDDLGYWTQGSMSIATRRKVIGDRDGGIQFEGALAADGTFLLPDGDVTSLVETRLDLGILFHAGKRGPKGGGFATWLSSSYALPVWHRGDDPASTMELDPQSRLSFAIGTMGSLLDKWDLIVELRVGDRGDLPFAPTRLPILDGGFDLRQLVFGVTYHGRYPKKKKQADQGDPLIMIP